MSYMLSYSCANCTRISICNGSSPFNDGEELEVFDGHPEGAAIPSLPDAQQEFSSGLDTELKKLTQQIRQYQKRR